MKIEELPALKEGDLIVIEALYPLSAYPHYNSNETIISVGFFLKKEERYSHDDRKDMWVIIGYPFTTKFDKLKEFIHSVQEENKYDFSLKSIKKIIVLKLDDIL